MYGKGKGLDIPHEGSDMRICFLAFTKIVQI